MKVFALGKVLNKKFRTNLIISFLLVLLTTFYVPIPYHPQVSYSQTSGIVQSILLGDISIGAIRKLLLDVLDRLDSSLRNAGTEIRASGNSLEGNANRIIKEIDQKFGNRLERTIKQLNASEKKFFEDVGRTVQTTENAILAIQKNAGEEARQTIFEADILAYNSSYSLPCRNKTPRIVYAIPNQVIVNNDDPFVRIRGNFLNIGNEARVTVDGTKAKVVARSSDEISIQIPDSVLNEVSDVKLSSVSMTLYQTTALPVFCTAKNSLINSPLQIGIKLTPQVAYQINGFIEGSYVNVIPESVQEIPQDFPQGVREIIDDNCEINESRKIEYSIPVGWEITNTKFTELSSGGSSYLEGIDPTGNKAAVRIRLIGKGYRTVREPLTGAILYRDCNGRGWLKYDLTLVGRNRIVTSEKSEKVALPREPFTISGSPGQTTFSDVRHSKANAGLKDVEWYYRATVIGTVGRKNIPPVEVSTNLPTAANITSVMGDGVLSVNILSKQ